MLAPSSTTNDQAPSRRQADPGRWSDLAPARPGIDTLLARDNWERAEKFFQAIQTRSLEAITAAYQRDAALDHPIIGLVTGEDISRLWNTFLRRTPEHQLDFTITTVNAKTAFVEWTSEHEFFETGRTVRLSGATLLTFSAGRIQFHHDSFDRHNWSRQALGLSGLILSYLPGSRSFLRDEARRAFGLAEHRA